MVKRQHARQRLALAADGEDIGILAQPVEHPIEQRAGKHRRAEIAHRFGVDGIVSGPIGLAASGRHGQIVSQPAPHFSALLARNAEQFSLVALRQITSETGVAVMLVMPAGTFRQCTAAQFDCRAGAAHGQFFGRLEQSGTLARGRFEQPPADGKAG